MNHQPYIKDQREPLFEAYRKYCREAALKPQASAYYEMGQILEQLHFYLSADHRYQKACQLAPADPKMQQKRVTIAPQVQHMRSLFQIPQASSCVSIVVLTYNQCAYTRRFMETLLPKTPELQELIVVDNGSSDNTPSYLEKLASQYPDRIRLIMNTDNQGFSVGCNQGAAIAKSDYILFMNNDLLVTEGWLARMLQAMEFHQADLVGPAMTNISGIQTVLDFPFDLLDEMDIREELAQQRALFFQNQGQETHRLVGTCLLVRRHVLETIGGFDPIFGIGNFEDDDFCYRALLAGFKLWWAKAPFLHHFGSVSFRQPSIDQQKRVTENWRIFCQKWHLPVSMDWGKTVYPIAAILEKKWLREQLIVNG